MESNELIAGFMGMKLVKDDDQPSDAAYEWLPPFKHSNWCFKSPPPFHTSWDWLMPVVEKIEGCYEGNISFHIYDYRAYVEMGTQYGLTVDVEVPQCYSGFCDTKLDAAYSTVIQFINWYNQHHTN